MGEKMLALGVAGQLVGGLQDRLWGIAERYKGMELLRGEQDPETGLEAQLKEQTRDWQTYAKQGVAGARQERIGDWEKFQGQLPDMEQMARTETGGAQQALRTAETARMGRLTEETETILSGARQRFDAISTNLDQHFVGITDRIDTGYADLERRFDENLSELRGKEVTAIQEVEDMSVAFADEARGNVLEIDTATDDAIAQGIASGGMTEAQAALLRQGAATRKTDVANTAIRAGKVATAQVKATLRAEFGGTIGGAMTNFGNDLVTYRASGDATLAKMATDVEATRAAASRDLSLTEIEANTMLDSSWHLSNAMLGDMDIWAAETIIQGVLSDVGMQGMVAQNIDAIKADAASQKLAITNAANEYFLNAIAAGADLTKMMASAHFNWQATIIPQQAIMGNVVDTYSSMMTAQANYAMATREPQQNWGAMVGEGVKSGASIAAAYA